MEKLLVNPGWIFIAVGQLIFWGSAHSYNRHLRGYDFWSSICNVGFWITFLGITFLIWG